MAKTFDELFNEFFKRNNIKPEDNIDDLSKEKAKNFIDLLVNFKDTGNMDEEIENQIDETLGKPDKIEFYNDGDIFYEKRIWYTPNGDLVKLIITDDPTFIQKPKKSLKEKLDQAVLNEEFELAANLRDEMNKIKKKEKKNKK